MRPIVFIIFLCTVIQVCQSQDLDENFNPFLKTELANEKLSLLDPSSIFVDINQNKFSFFHNTDIMNSRFMSNTLNERIFSNLSLFEYDFTKHSNLSVNCVYLENGISNKVNNHGGAMLAHILNNYLNKYVFKGRIIQRLF